MAGLSYADLNLSTDIVKSLLDEPAQRFLKDDTITATIQRAYNLISSQLEITVTNQNLVTDAIYAIGAWHSFGAYGQSISKVLQVQDLSTYETNLEYYKDIVLTYENLLAINLIGTVSTTETELEDSGVPAISVGNSELDY